MSMSDTDSLRDEINIELDHRKLQKLVDDGVITQKELDNAPIIDETEEPPHE